MSYISFIVSYPVVDEGFAYRKELETILNSLKPPLPSFNVYGPERSGKSSLLRHLCEVAGPRRYHDYRWCYVDMQGVLSPQEFLEDYQHILNKIDKPTVFCLDEFGAIFSGRHTSPIERYSPLWL
jgi:AAA+ ATPase superfamily predicted ATPase